MKKTIITCIVPVYNVEKYIRDCIESIIAQTFKNWELILVDDGSPDNSGRICDKYAKVDERITVFHKENGGVSSARNYGIEKANGEWVTFVDADDTILPNFFENLYKPIAEGYTLDFIHAGCCNMVKGRIIGVNQSYEYFISNDPNYVFIHLRGLVASKLFRLELLNKHYLRFDVQMRIAEDMAFTLDYILMIRNYAFVPELGYCYRNDNEASATKSKVMIPYHTELHSFRHLYTSTIAFVQKYNIPNSNCKLRYSQRASQLQNTILTLYRSRYSRKERLFKLRNDFTKQELLLLKYLDFKDVRSILFYVLTCNVFIFDLLLSIIFRFKKNI